MMHVLPEEGDTPEILALKAELDDVWQETVRLQRALAVVDTRNAQLRGNLRLLQEKIAVGDTMVLGAKRIYGTVELSTDYPYLWLREVGANGKPTKRRYKMDNVYYEKAPARTFEQGQ